jgi:hypothetical protein
MRGPAVGEVIAVATTTFVAQSYTLNESPAFGSLLIVPGPRDEVYFGLCAGTETGAIEPGRHAMAWGTADGESEDIYARQPQLAHVLRTTFTCILVGYSTSAGVVAQRVPPMPPRVHERVWLADMAAAAAFFTELTYLRFLLRSGVENAEDLIAASIGCGYRAHALDRGFLVGAGRAVARLLAGDYERLQAVLELLTDMEETQ